MKAILKFSLCVAMLGSFAGCGVGLEDDNTYSALDEKNAKALNDLFDNAKGTYKGTFTFADGSITPKPGTLRLYVNTQADEGSNPDGTTHWRPVLFGRFQLDEFVQETDYLPMKGNYDKQGNLNISGIGTISKGSATPVTIRLGAIGFVGNDRASVAIQTTNSTLGRFEGPRVSRDADAASGGDEQELYERLVAIYSRIEGRYRGTIDSGSAKAPIEIQLTMVESAAGGAGTRQPYLIGQYKRLDFPTGIGEKQLAVNFDSLTGNITMSATSGGGSVPGSTTLSVSGTWINQVLDVRLRDKSGNLGRLKTKRSPGLN